MVGNTPVIPRAISHNPTSHKPVYWSGSLWFDIVLVLQPLRLHVLSDLLGLALVPGPLPPLDLAVVGAHSAPEDGIATSIVLSP